MSLPVTHELGPGSVVAVTGAGGFLASQLVSQLLAKGVTVHGTLREPSKPSKRDHLLALPGAAERLKLFQADLVDAGAAAALAAAFAGCSVVFHTACPFFSLADGKKLGMDFYTAAAIGGTNVVLEACAAAAAVERVVVTSSTAAIFRRVVPAGHVYSEADWNDCEELATREYWYAIAKTKQEQAVWSYTDAAPRRFTAVCINPTLIGGPQLAPELNTSTQSVLEYVSLSAPALIPNSGIPWVDVRDVAAAHVAAAERRDARGRFLMISSWEPSSVMCAALRAVAPPELAARVPSVVDVAEGAKAVVVGDGVPLHDSSRVTRELGVAYRGIEEIMRGSVESLVKHGLIPAAA